MKIKLMIAFIVFTLSLFSPVSFAGTYGNTLCKKHNYMCVKVNRGQTWEKLFPDSKTRDVVKRLNRMNIQLQAGMTIAVPRSTRWLNKMDVAPFPSKISNIKKSTVLVDQSELAWGAYNENGTLINWGPISGGKSYCPDIGRGCRTIHGKFTVQRKQGAGCISNKFPIGKGGAKMPYCMFFHGGFALHGSYQVPGYNASHGCVRLFIEDAQWLNTEFVRSGETHVIVQN